MSHVKPIDEFTKDCIREAEAIEAKQKPLRQELEKLSDEHYAIRERLLAHVWKIKVGTVVKDHRGKLHTIVRIRTWQTIQQIVENRPWLTVVSQKKDGTFGTADHKLYDEWVRMDEE
jgi:hypothetical protein